MWRTRKQKPSIGKWDIHPSPPPSNTRIPKAFRLCFRSTVSAIIWAIAPHSNTRNRRTENRTTWFMAKLVCDSDSTANTVKCWSITTPKESSRPDMRGNRVRCVNQGCCIRNRMMVFHVHSLFVYRRQFDVRKDQWSYRKNAVQWSLISPWAMLYFFLMAYLLRGCRGILPQCEDARNRSNVSTWLLVFWPLRFRTRQFVKMAV